MNEAPLTTAEDYPLPPGGTAGFAETPDGTPLRWAVWRADRPKGSLLLIPGRGEFIEKYTEVIGELLARRFCVGVHEPRGQGLSRHRAASAARGNVSDFALYTGDAAQLLSGPFADLPRPKILLGHSMGGHIGIALLRAQSQAFAGAVFSAPMLGLKTGPYPRPIARLIAGAACGLGLGRRFVPGGAAHSIFDAPFESNEVTHDPARYRRTQAFTQADPALAIGSATLGWLNAAFHAMAGLHRPGVAETIHIPCLFVLAGEETIADNRRIRAFAQRMPQATLVEIAGARHEILMERDQVRAEFWQAFDAFCAPLLRG